jgi:dimeric dUTPase (all-alpha-NTP-PPase superfamily)
MELNQLFKIQEIMENNIKNNSMIDEDVLGKENIFDLRFLALQVKVGEIANLTKCYKYNVAKEDIPKEKLMYRFIDAMKYMLSIGNMYEFNIIDIDAVNTSSNEKSLIKVFSYIYDDIADLKDVVRRDNYVDSITIYIRLFSRFINLGRLLGFTFQEVYDYYLKLGTVTLLTESK